MTKGERQPTRDTPEFPPGVDLPPAELDRRDMMKLLATGASLAGLGPLAACMERPRERILPWIEQPPELTPGVPLEYATSMVLDGFATGLVVKTMEARPIKVEGNPEHPASLGATSSVQQASLLELYDPGRARGALEAGAPAALDRLIREIAQRERMAGLWFLLHPQSSPLIEQLMAAVRARHPGAEFAFYSPVDRREVYAGAQLVFGRPLEAQYRFARADVVVSLDGDFMASMPNSLRWARDFARRRRPGWPIGEPSRLYLAEARPTPTGSLADHRLPVRPSQIRELAAALFAAVSRAPGARAAPLPAPEQRWVAAAARELRSRRGRSLVVAGDRQPRQVHALVHLINQAIGAAGETIGYTRPAIIEPFGAGLPDLARAIRTGEVRTLVIAEANPLYSAPAELDLAGLLPRVPETVYAAPSANETSRRCRWFVPLTHFMESWGDARAYDGTVSFVQPLIRPLYGGLSLPELLAAFAGERRPDGYQMLLERHGPSAGRGSEALLSWQRSLRRGFISGSSLAEETPRAALLDPASIARPERAAGEPAAIELSFEPSPSVHDGRFAHLAWLQELPKPIDKITWGNAAILGPRTAAELGVTSEDVIRIDAGGHRLELPAFVLPGCAEGCISLELGYGRWGAGPVADEIGGNAYRIRTLAAPGFARARRVSPTGRRRAIARTQEHLRSHGREIALSAALEHYRSHPEFTEPHRRPQPTLLPEQFPDTPKWGMTIDTGICSGCSACVIACQAENNIPVVGQKGVIDNREMHWLRIDTYLEDEGDALHFVHQPMLCQHCAKAPCEYVCPVYATQHSPDGLNEMIYNRCIGTRFCSNNCPYKVRRFNWFDYTEDTPKLVRLQQNPNVTVRARGVMEKCTYCVQRIRAAEIRARKEQREIGPGEVTTACQQACPTRAIQFGQLHHQDSEVVAWRSEPRRYAVLNHLGTEPRTMYLAAIRNPNPALKG